MKELRLPADAKHIEEAMDFVAVSVKEKTSKQREIVQATLIAEESIMSVITNSRAGTEMILRIAKGMNGMSLIVQSEGNEFDLGAVSDSLTKLKDNNGVYWCRR